MIQNYNYQIFKVKRLMKNHRENPIKLNIGNKIQIQISNRDLVTIHTEISTESFHLEECSNNILVFITLGLENPLAAKHLKGIEIIPRNQIQYPQQI